MRNICSFLISIFSLAAICQSGTLTIHGRVEDGSTKLDEVDIEIIKDNQYEDEFQNYANGSYKLRLELVLFTMLPLGRKAMYPKQLE